MKKLLSVFIMLLLILTIGCSENKKREEYIDKAYSWFEGEVNEYNKTQVTDKIELEREDNVITYTMRFSDWKPVSELHKEGYEGLVEMAKDLRQSTVDSLAYYYDNIVEKFGDDYDIILKSKKSIAGEEYLITRYDKDGYAFEYDLFEELGY